jgi:plastocyanin domain-containing protein
MKKLVLGALATLALAVAIPAAASAPAEKPTAVPIGKNGVSTVQLTVTSKGFEPANVKVKAGHPVRLVVTRKTDQTCAKEIILEDLGINQPLPLDTPVTVEFTPSESGTLRYACSMDHIGGVVTIQ